MSNRVFKDLNETNSGFFQCFLSSTSDGKVVNCIIYDGLILYHCSRLPFRSSPEPKEIKLRTLAMLRPLSQKTIAATQTSSPYRVCGLGPSNLLPEFPQCPMQLSMNLT